MFMPNWLQLQLQRAFANKNKRQIVTLNQCWYYYKLDIE